MLTGKVLNSTGFIKVTKSWNNWPFTLKNFKPYNSQRKKVLMHPVRLFLKKVLRKERRCDTSHSELRRM